MRVKLTIKNRGPKGSFRILDRPGRGWEPHTSALMGPTRVSVRTGEKMSSKGVGVVDYGHKCLPLHSQTQDVAADRAVPIDSWSNAVLLYEYVVSDQPPWPTTDYRVSFDVTRLQRHDSRSSTVTTRTAKPEVVGAQGFRVHLESHDFGNGPHEMVQGASLPLSASVDQPADVKNLEIGYLFSSESTPLAADKEVLEQLVPIETAEVGTGGKATEIEWKPDRPGYYLLFATAKEPDSNFVREWSCGLAVRVTG